MRQQRRVEPRPADQHLAQLQAQLERLDGEPVAVLGAIATPSADASQGEPGQRTLPGPPRPAHQVGAGVDDPATVPAPPSLEAPARASGTVLLVWPGVLLVSTAANARRRGIHDRVAWSAVVTPGGTRRAA